MLQSVHSPHQHSIPSTSDIKHRHQARHEAPPCAPQCANPTVNHRHPQFPGIHQLPRQIFATSCRPCQAAPAFDLYIRANQTFLTATSRDNVLCLVIKLVNECDRKANHRQEGYLAPYYIIQNNLAIDQGLLLKADQIVMPSKLRRQLMNKAHKGHPNIVRAKIKLCGMYWWPGIAADIEENIPHTQGCQDSAKSNSRLMIPTDPLLLLKAPWLKIALDHLQWHHIKIDLQLLSSITSLVSLKFDCVPTTLLKGGSNS
uniref:RNA-directed DNA polymerase n=1 Tax=Romanomermis culicivorax TaxID=13658 RepID=A0A915JNR5_ROMCU